MGVVLEYHVVKMGVVLDYPVVKVGVVLEYPPGESVANGQHD